MPAAAERAPAEESKRTAFEPPTTGTTAAADEGGPSNHSPVGAFAYFTIRRDYQVGRRILDRLRRSPSDYPTEISVLRQLLIEHYHLCTSNLKCTCTLPSVLEIWYSEPQGPARPSPACLRHVERLAQELGLS